MATAFLDEIEDALARQSLPLGVFNDERIFALEKQRIFARSWCYLGHESEIPHAGDYMVRYIVDDAFIVTRDNNGAIHVLLNACRHRGRPVCSAELGNTRSFTRFMIWGGALPVTRYSPPTIRSRLIPSSRSLRGTSLPPGPKSFKCQCKPRSACFTAMQDFS